MSDYQPRHDLDPVFYNGVQVNDLTWLSGGGVGCRITGISGWQDNIDVRDVRDSKPGQHGEDASNAYMGGRTITIQGEVDGSTFANLQSRLRTLATTFAPTTSEVVLKMPDPSQASPTTSYAAEISGYERAYCKVVEAITFGEKSGPFNQSWQVVLKASDPRIYNDVTTTDDYTISSYAGTTSTPIKIEAKLYTNDKSGAITTSSPSVGTIAVVGDTSSWYSYYASYTTTTQFVVDGGIDGSSRQAYFKMPSNLSRLLMNDLRWMYRLNETSGTTIDNYEGTAAYDGTTAGTPTLNQSGPLTDTKSISFDGVDDRITRAWASALFPSEFTFEAWYKKSSGLSSAIDYTGPANAGGFLVTPRATTLDITVLSLSGNSTPIASISGLTSATWYHIAFTYRSGVFNTYLNGSLVSTVLATFEAPTSGTMYLGYDRNAATYWAGNLSSVAMHTKAYSSSIISDMYNGGSASSIVRYKAGAYIQSVNQWPSISAATTYDGRYSVSPTVMTTTYRTARL